MPGTIACAAAMDAGVAVLGEEVSKREIFRVELVRVEPAAAAAQEIAAAARIRCADGDTAPQCGTALPHSSSDTAASVRRCRDRRR